MTALTVFSALLLLLNGICLTVKSKFFAVLHIKTVFKVTVVKTVKTKDFSGFKAMSLALGSTIGIGNIVGVSAAIIIGGAGAVFWLILTGFLGMVIKYSEIYLSLKTAQDHSLSSGGPMYVFLYKTNGFFKIFGIVFAVVTLFASFFSGNLMQAMSVYRFAEMGFGVDVMPLSCIILPCLGFILMGKDTLYQNFSAVFVPIMSLFYIISALIIVCLNIENLPLALLSVLTSAFGYKPLLGGFSGAVLIKAFRVGVMKGLFTHEAGMGSAPIAHASNINANPITQGLWGMVEVFIDTCVVCLVTALAVLTSPEYINGGYFDPFALICDIFSGTFGSFGLKALCLSSCCFGFAAIVGWSFYGIKSLKFLTESSFAEKLYILAFLFFVPLSTLVNESAAWLLTDFFNAVMLIINSCLLLYFGGKAAETLDFKKGSENNGLYTVSATLQRRKNRLKR